MRAVPFASLLTGLVLSTAVPSTAAAGAATHCLRVNDVWNWKPVSDTALVVETRAHTKFRLTLQSVCPAIRDRNFVLELHAKSKSQLACVERFDAIRLHNALGTQDCLIDSVEPLAAPAR